MSPQPAARQPHRTPPATGAVGNVRAASSQPRLPLSPAPGHCLAAAKPPTHLQQQQLDGVHQPGALGRAHAPQQALELSRAQPPACGLAAAVDGGAGRLQRQAPQQLRVALGGGR
jgi:hypothetical protein